MTMHDALTLGDDRVSPPQSLLDERDDDLIMMADSEEPDLSLDQTTHAGATLRPQTGRGKVVCQTCMQTNESNPRCLLRDFADTLLAFYRPTTQSEMLWPV